MVNFIFRRTHTNETYPCVRHDMLITMICFPTHADIMLEVYKQKTCIRFSILHAPSTASALVAHGRGGVWRELARVIPPAVHHGLGWIPLAG